MNNVGSFTRPLRIKTNIKGQW